MLSVVDPWRMLFFSVRGDAGSILTFEIWENNYREQVLNHLWIRGDMSAFLLNLAEVYTCEYAVKCLHHSVFLSEMTSCPVSTCECTHVPPLGSVGRLCCWGLSRRGGRPHRWRSCSQHCPLLTPWSCPPAPRSCSWICTAGCCSAGGQQPHLWKHVENKKKKKLMSHSQTLYTPLKTNRLIWLMLAHFYIIFI